MKKTDEQIREAAKAIVTLVRTKYKGAPYRVDENGETQYEFTEVATAAYKQALSDMQEQKGDVEELKKQLLNIIQATDTCFAHTDEQRKYCDKNCEGYGCPVWLTTRDQIFNFFLPYLHQPDKDWEKYAAAFAEWSGERFDYNCKTGKWCEEYNCHTTSDLLSLFKESEEYKQLIK